jgi:(1->4)-alpha-D-glucan 1-alpha-D-glucosylmutase
MSPAESARRPLGSTYRLQLPGLGFGGALKVVGYLHQLGVETLYVSPILAAVPGSTHGYDVIDPTRLDPQLGTPAEFEALLAELARHDMRLLVDVVPNHMATDPANAWWWDVLRQGEGSAFAPTYDIDWPAQQGRVLVPTLGQPLRELLEEGAVGVDRPGPRPELVIDGQHFPLRPGSAPRGRAGHTEAVLQAVLARQHFRPAYWRLSAEEGNYRRFFDIDGLIGVRVEDPAVFDATHRVILDLAQDDRLAGWRVDHVDGLADPGAYLTRLRAELTTRGAGSAVVLIEKILAEDETVRPSWEADGTTGYEFADVAGGLFVDPEGAALVEAAGVALSGDDRSFAQLALAAKREVLDASFPAPLRRLVDLVGQALDADRPGHDVSPAMIERALHELTVQFDAYRTYIDDGPIDPRDRDRLVKAAAAARPGLSPDQGRALDLLCAGLLRVGGVTGPGAAYWAEAARRWQQLTGAVTAKGVEDTATYRFSGLLGHAEVGSDPSRPAVSPAEFLARTRTVIRGHRSSLNTTSTHDSKRSEDVRARLYALSELAGEWNGLVTRWHRRHAAALRQAGGPDGHDELVAYQTVAAMWPTAQARPSAEACRRMQDYVVKAAREEKHHTSWTDPDQHYERALRAFIRRLSRSPGTPFDREMARVVGRIAPAAATTSLALAVLKSVCPGVPDLYQGTELWDFSLTDPDNRRPIDFGRHRRLLETQPDDDAPATERRAHAAALLATWPDGRIKLHVLHTLLTLRRAQPHLFEHGSYDLLAAKGDGGEHVVGVVRRSGSQWLMAFVPRLTLEQAGPSRFPVGRRVWGTTAAELPAQAPARYTDVLTGSVVRAARGRLDLGDVLATLPVAVLLGRS